MRSGFFNSEIIGYDIENMPVFDRAEEASFFAKYFSQFISNGVFPNPSTNLQVLAVEGMQIKVDIGTCFINGYLGWAETAETFEIEESESHDRIDRIVARLDFSDRSIKLFVKKGTSSGNPIAPELQRDYDIYEIGLADVLVKADTIEIQQENITDLRMSKEVCGEVACIVEQVDTTTLFNQYQDWLNTTIEKETSFIKDGEQQFEDYIKTSKEQFTHDFEEWFETIKGKLDGDVGAKLTKDVEDLQNNKADKKELPSSAEKEKWNKATDDYTKLNNRPTKLSEFNNDIFVQSDSEESALASSAEDPTKLYYWVEE